MTLPRQTFLWELFSTLRTWSFPLSPQDYQSLHDALNAGFGWQSLADLRFVCAAVWAKSKQEQEILYSVFDRLSKEFGWEEWRDLTESESVTPQINFPQEPSGFSPASKQDESASSQKTEHKTQDEFPIETPPALQSETGGISNESLVKAVTQFSDAYLILNPRYIISYRQVAQAWRRLRRTVCTGPKTELDTQATIALRCAQGVATPMVLRARPRNAVRLLLLVDRRGSMTPFHHFIDNAVHQAISQSGRFEYNNVYYFHDVPAGKRSADNNALLQALSGQLYPPLEKFAGKVQALNGGYVYAKPSLRETVALPDILKPHTGGATVIISDAGAARGNYDTARLLDTLAFLKTLSACTPHVVWLNPLPPEAWRDNSAAQIARCVPMFPVDREGLHQAVNVLRGQIHDLDYPFC